MVVLSVLLVAVTARSLERAIVETPEQLIDASIAYHDPNGAWDTARIHLNVHTTYSPSFAEKAGSKEADIAIVLSPGHDAFSYVKDTGADKIEIAVRGDDSAILVNGSEDVSEEDKERLRLRDPQTYRDYCEYLYGMPMKLRDPGTLLDPGVVSTRFNDRDVWQLKATYTPEVGKHTWYFYFDRDTFALVGYRFYLDESQNDGEYIAFDGEIVDEISGLRLPKSRAWYYNADHGHLATDDIILIKIIP